MRYFKKPVEVEAVQWNGQNRKEVEALVRGPVRFAAELVALRVGHAFPSDYIVREGASVFICDQATFRATYEQCGGSGEGRR